jgi:hypothetical protein
MTYTNPATGRYNRGFRNDSINIKLSLCRLLKRLLFVTATLIGLLTSGCAQGSERSVAPDEISVEFRHIAKRGDVKKAVVALSGVPNAPPIPQTYRPFVNKAYKIETETIDLGDPLVAVKVEANNEDDFKAVRVLRLIANEMRPRGFEWQDCTVSVETVLAFEGPTPASWHSLDAYREVYSSYFPDYKSRQVRCEIQDRMKPLEHLVLVRQIEPVPTKTFTQLKFSLDSQSVSDDGNVTYEITFRNAGPKEIADLSFRSAFGSDTLLNSMKPSSGKCVRSAWATLYGSVVCHTGRVPVGASTTIQLTGSFRAVPGGGGAGKRNRDWDIVVVISERENDPLWAVNRLFIRPLGE